MIKLLLLRHGEEIISTVKEIVEPETEKPLGYHLHKPFRLDIIDSKEGQGYQLDWFPWAPLSKERDFFLPGHHVLTAYDPLDSIVDQYLLAIKDENYDENFKRHEGMVAGESEDELDMEQLFADAEKLLEEDDADSTNNS